MNKTEIAVLLIVLLVGSIAGILLLNHTSGQAYYGTRLTPAWGKTTVQDKASNTLPATIGKAFFRTNTSSSNTTNTSFPPIVLQRIPIGSPCAVTFDNCGSKPMLPAAKGKSSLLGTITHGFINASRGEEDLCSVKFLQMNATQANSTQAWPIRNSPTDWWCGKVTYSWFGISMNVSNVQKSYRSTQFIRPRLSVTELDGTQATADEGFVVSARDISLQTNSTSQRNVTYNQRKQIWEIEPYRAPSLGNYYLNVQVHCATFPADSYCNQYYGYGGTGFSTYAYRVAKR